MKIVKPQEMARVEKLAYQAGYSENSFMENAGKGVAKLIEKQNHQKNQHVVLLCGKGNNAGDALVAGHELLQKGFQVTALQLFPLSDCSELCQFQFNRFLQSSGKIIFSNEIWNITPSFLQTFAVIIDGIFGTGFKGKVEGIAAHLIDLVNQARHPVIAVDIPSGLNGETGEASESTIIANDTVFLGLPKQGFYIGDGWNYVGKLQHVDFGLPDFAVAQAKPEYELLTLSKIQSLIPPIQRNRQKYQAGYVVGFAGSETMPGAALLSSLSALRGGAGIVRLLHHANTTQALTNSPYELIKTPVTNAEEALEYLNKAGATFVGPGLGRDEKVHHLLANLLPQINKPTVIDADALYILSQDRSIKLPAHSILTPHHGEMSKLLNIPTPKTLNDAFISLVQDYAVQHNVTVVLKGGPTFIFHPDKSIYVNPTGDPGMATAGSGDVLTGLLAALLAQGNSPLQAAQIGVFLHGLAGEFAAHERTSRSMIASDLIKYFSCAWKTLLNLEKNTPHHSNRI